MISSFKNKFIAKSTSNKKTPHDINVILLGESGVGKSTFVNSLANYFQSASLAEAEIKQLSYLISTYFTLTDENYNQVEVRLGANQNESTKVGLACTLNAMSHTIKVNDELTLNLIDTPGVGDPLGFERDKINFRNTIAHISRYNRLNGICVLLKPNNARLDAQFRFCFKELLLHLHRNAAPNIVFCFTNSRSTFYRPGDSLPALKVLIESIEKESNLKIPLGADNIFCFDNEGFRFLAAAQQGVRFTEQEKTDFSSSWTRSSENAKKMIEYISGLKVHSVEETINLNKARDILIELAKPLAEISQNIQTNIKLADDKKKELQSLDFSSYDANSLNDELYIKQISFESKNLTRPRTVCTDVKCTKVVKIGGVDSVDYIQHCHPECYLDGITENTINNLEIKNCACMDDGTCRECNHDWSLHMHITYELIQIEQSVIDENVQKMIEQNESSKIVIESSIQSITDLIEQLKTEQQEIIEISSKFAVYTIRNAIAVFNDDLDSYLDLLIREEENKKQAGADNDQVLNGLRDVKQNYIAQKKIFQNALGAAQNRDIYVSHKDIEKLVDDLYNLPMSGAKIKGVIDNLHSKNNQ